jgi:UDP-N-acetylglucosamine--N-acetylmuramyl-(pentapeptide) pyrophosphoryl-undecaprenol N-acetylglucosamine transferase
MVKEFKPDFVIGTGGFVSFPVVFAASLLKKKTLIHEPNMVPGIANRLLSGFADFITVGFEETLKYFPQKKTIVAGNPIRPGLKGKSRKAGLAAFSLSPSKKTVLVMPGSRAAHKINETLILALEAMEKEIKGIQVLWMCGKADLKEVKEAAAGHKKIKIRAFDFIHDVDSAYAASDAGIMRAGASTLSEITALKFPAILVPYPHATDNHQEKNAAVFEKRRAGLVIKDRDLTPATLVTAMKKILDNRENSLMRKNLKSMHKGNGAEKIADIITGERNAA